MLSHIDTWISRRADLAALSLFGALRRDPLFAAFNNLLELATRQSPGPRSHEKSEGPSREAAFETWMTELPLMVSGAWAVFLEQLLEAGGDWRLAVAERTAAAENLFTMTAENGRWSAAPPSLAVAAATDLRRLSRIAAVDPTEIGVNLSARLAAAGQSDAARDLAETAQAISLASLEATTGSESAADRTPIRPSAAVRHPAVGIFLKSDHWDAEIDHFTQTIKRYGAGWLGCHRSFIWSRMDAAASLKPLRLTDPIRLADLCGYAEQRSFIEGNTQRFLDGKGADNLFLYGDRGTGKTATIKAIANEFAARGLRVVELRPEAYADLSELLEYLAGRAARFIVLADNLNLEETGGAGLKILLEGGAENHPENVLIYAVGTRPPAFKDGNRVRADASAPTAATPIAEPPSPDLQTANRFGTTVVFLEPDRETYLTIAEFLADRRGLLPSDETARGRFRDNALRWERRFGSRSPRAAKRYVDWIAGNDELP